jgi:sugar lactone lactonase YvrE
VAGYETRRLAGGFAFLEGPRWHDGRLWFSDFNTHLVHRLEPDGTVATVCEVPQQPSGLGFTPEGDLLVVSMLDHRLMRLDLADPTGGLVEVADLSAYQGGPANDLLVDTQGRAYVGNFGADVDHGEPERATALLRVDPDGSVRVAAEGLEVPNGMAITRDGRSFVVAESLACRVSVFDLADDGTLSDQQTWVQFPLPDAFTFAATHDGEHVVPDGVCLDAEDALWVADAGGTEVVRVARGGEVLDRIDLGPRHSAYACMLGGADGRSLYLCVGGRFGEYDRETDERGELWVAEVDVPAPWAVA